MTATLLGTILLGVMACHGDPAADPDAALPCEALAFAATTPVPEASGAGWLTIDGRSVLVVVGDSDNDGAYALVDPDTGTTIEQGTLPLGGAGDDLEGVAARGGKLYGLTSAGWMRVWVRNGAAFELAEPMYPIGPVDLPDAGGGGESPPMGDGMVCEAATTNCGRNYEGLALVDTAHESGPCVGYAMSKADGHLYCLTDEAGKLVVQRAMAIAITRPGALADAAFSDDGMLWVGSNLLELSQVYRVDGWSVPATATVVPVAQIGVGFPETIAARGDVIYRMSDTGSGPSEMAKYRCTR